MDAYQEEMISLRHNLHRNNDPERITSALRNVDRRIEDKTQNLDNKIVFNIFLSSFQSRKKFTLEILYQL